MRPHDEDDEPMHQDDEQKPPQQEAIHFGSTPVSIKCPFCLQHTKTEIIAKPELISIVFGLVLFSVLPNAIMIIVVVVALQLTATKKHRCSLCERELGTDGKFLVIFTDEVYSFSFGETGILVSKKILVTIGLFLSIFVILSLKGSTDDVKWTPIGWQAYQAECPIEPLNPACASSFEGMSVKNWKGYVMRVEDERQSMRRFYDHAVKLFVKMEPSEQPSHLPDLFLTGSTTVVYQFSEVLDNLRHGDQIEFNATFRKSSNEREIPQGRHLHIYGINSTGQHNPAIELYVKTQEEEWVGNRVEGQRLRTEASHEETQAPPEDTEAGQTPASNSPPSSTPSAGDENV